MADLLRYVLTHFWPFVGTLVLIGAVGNAVADIVSAYRFPREPSA